MFQIEEKHHTLYFRDEDKSEKAVATFFNSVSGWNNSGYGYPEDKLALHFNEKGSHSVSDWRSVFSEFLTAMAFRHIVPLQKQ